MEYLQNGYSLLGVEQLPQPLMPMVLAPLMPPLTSQQPLELKLEAILSILKRLIQFFLSVELILMQIVIPFQAVMVILQMMPPLELIPPLRHQQTLTLVLAVHLPTPLLQTAQILMPLSAAVVVVQLPLVILLVLMM